MRKEVKQFQLSVKKDMNVLLPKDHDEYKFFSPKS